jgi:hypothetical protein
MDGRQWVRLSREYLPDAVFTNRASDSVAFELELAPKTREWYAKKFSGLWKS